MKKLLLTTAIVMSFGTTAAFAHHPAVDMVDEDTYLMIDENLIDTPHYDMTFDDMDMGGDVEVGGTAASRDMEDGSAQIGEARDDIGAAMEDREEMNAMADAEGSGPMGANAQK